MSFTTEQAFNILELPSTATWEEVRQAYREMVKVWHPDRFPNDEKFKQRATRKIQDINTAYKLLEVHLKHQSAAKHSPPPNPQEQHSSANQPPSAASTAKEQPASDDGPPSFLEHCQDYAVSLLLVCYIGWGSGGFIGRIIIGMGIFYVTCETIGPKYLMRLCVTTAALLGVAFFTDHSDSTATIAAWGVLITIVLGGIKIVAKLIRISN